MTDVNNVYLGIWQNASEPGLSGTILTTGDTRGQILVSVLTVFVTIAGGYFWILVSLALYRFVLNRQEIDGLDLQQQVVLRNTSSAFTSGWELVKIWWAWRKSIGHHSAGPRTALPLATIVVVWVAVFAAATTLPLIISKGENAGDQVLVLMKERPHRCGSLDFGHLGPSSWDYDMYVASLQKNKEDMNRAKQIAYDRVSHEVDDIRPNVVTFPKPVLPSFTSKNQPCPVTNTSRCKLGENGAIEVTSGKLDSALDFGINQLPEHRVTFERKAVCSPIDVKDLISNNHLEYSDDVGVHYLSVYMGTTRNTLFNATASVPIIFISEAGYLLTAQSWQPDYPWSDNSDWIPSDEFIRNNADISVLFLNGNGILYRDQNNDPFFEANRYEVNETIDLGSGPEKVTKYRLNDWISVMYCTEQYSICNVANSKCTKPMGLSQLTMAVNNTDLNLNPTQRLTAFRIGYAAGSSGLSQMATLGGSAVLASRLLSYNFLSPRLPDDQWQKEVQYWFDIALVYMQVKIQEYAIAPSSNDYNATFLPGAEGFAAWEKGPSSDKEAFLEAGRKQCGLQLMQSMEGVVNFRMIYIIWVLVFCFLLCLLGWTVEPILTILIKWKWGFDSKWRRGRIADDKLHLLRMAIDNGDSNVIWDSDANGNHPVITSYAKMTRPDFDGYRVSYRKTYESVPLHDNTSSTPSLHKHNIWFTTTQSVYAPSISSQTPIVSPRAF